MNKRNGFKHHTFTNIYDAVYAAKGGQFWEGDAVTVEGFTYRVGSDWTLHICQDPLNTKKDYAQ